MERVLRWFIATLKGQYTVSRWGESVGAACKRARVVCVWALADTHTRRARKGAGTRCGRRRPPRCHRRRL